MPSRKSRRSRALPRRKSAPRRVSKKVSLPKTARIPSRRSAQKSTPRSYPERASSNMSLGELQNMARSRGIPHGGISKNNLIRKINLYF